MDNQNAIELNAKCCLEPVMNQKPERGFTLIELVVVIIVLGILAVTAAPKFLDLSKDARIEALNSIGSQIESTTQLVQAKARVKGLVPIDSNPGGGQTDYIVDFEFGSVELDFRNLCPEAQGELGDSLEMLDFMNIDLTGGLTAESTNQYYKIGYTIPSGVPTNQGCYLIYDSFGDPDCTVQVVDVDC